MNYSTAKNADQINLHGISVEFETRVGVLTDVLLTDITGRTVKFRCLYGDINVYVPDERTVAQEMPL